MYNVDGSIKEIKANLYDIFTQYDVVINDIERRISIEQNQDTINELSNLRRYYLQQKKAAMTNVNNFFVHIDNMNICSNQYLDKFGYGVENSMVNEVNQKLNTAADDMEDVEEVVDSPEVVQAQDTEEAVDSSEVVQDQDTEVPVDSSEVVQAQDTEVPVDSSEVVQDQDTEVPVDNSEVAQNQDTGVPVDSPEVAQDQDTGVPVDNSEVVQDQDIEVSVDNSEVVQDQATEEAVDSSEVVQDQDTEVVQDTTIINSIVPTIELASPKEDTNGELSDVVSDSSLDVVQDVNGLGNADIEEETQEVETAVSSDNQNQDVTPEGVAPVIPVIPEEKPEVVNVTNLDEQPVSLVVLPAENESSDKTVFVAEPGSNSKAILVNVGQYSKLHSSRLDKKNEFAAYLEDSTQNVSEDELEEMLKQVTVLYNEGKQNEAEALSNKISVLSKKMTSENAA